ncbi:hypothetical protein DOY81_010664 [Sarcophaga bullata]|nr:hypothetical protein DOY81_010664 [Sarcophaga bullata]
MSRRIRNSEGKSWWSSGKKLFNIQRAESGEKAWWLDDTDEVKNDNESKVKPLKRNDSKEANWVGRGYKSAKSNFSATKTNKRFTMHEADMKRRIRIQQLPHYRSLQQHNSNGCAATTTQQQQQQQQPFLDAPTNFMAGGPPHLSTARHLPESIATKSITTQQQHQQPIFSTSKQQNYLQQASTPHLYQNNDLRSRNTQQFISRHQNIDELLGGSSNPPLSPAPALPPLPSLQQHQTCNNNYIEEITPDQVRIHDSTAQLPYIQRMERDDWPRDSMAQPTTPPRFEQRMIKEKELKQQQQQQQHKQHNLIDVTNFPTLGQNEISLDIDM